MLCVVFCCHMAESKKTPPPKTSKEATSTASVKAQKRTAGTRKSIPSAQNSSSTSQQKRKRVGLKHFVRQHKILSTLLLLMVGVLVASTILIVLFLRELPSPSRLNSPDNFPVSTQIFDRHNTLLYEIFADENRIPIELKDLPPHVYQASIAIEDKHFYQHFGFDFIGITRGLWRTIFKQSLQGGSTITQQLVKNALLTRERTIERKLKEAVLTIATEVLYSKDDILEMYLNHISYGGTSYGIEAAAKSYFDKSARDLSIAEAALLAGLPQAPSRYSPFQSDAKVSKNRQLDVIRRMREDGFITDEQAKQAEEEQLKFALSKTTIRAPHFVFYVKDKLVEKYGLETVEQGGLRVKTTLDIGIQDILQASLSAELAELESLKVGNGAALITRPNTGEILAMIGSKDYFDATAEGQVNVTIEPRQPGSSIKPINLAIAFEERTQTPASMLLDISTCFEQVGNTPYCPKNYDGTFHGPVQQRFSLGNSYNIPAVKTAAINSVPTLLEYAKRLGINTWDKGASEYGFSLGLGAGEVKMVEFAEAYGILANQGVRAPLNPILEISDHTGKMIESVDPQQRKEALKAMSEDESITLREGLSRVLQRAPAYLVSHILLDNNARSGAFGSNSQLVIKDKIVSVKTGTTNSLRDNWTVGYTPELLTMVWVGNNDNTPMNQRLVSGVTGAAPIWNDMMTYLLKDVETAWPEKPQDVISLTVCSLSGLLPNPGAPCPTRNEFFWEGTEPTEMENISKEIWIDPTTGIPPKPGVSWEGLNLQLQRHTVLSDPFTTDYCLDCTRPVNEEGKVQWEQHFIPANHQPNLRPNETEQAADPGQLPAGTPIPQ